MSFFSVFCFFDHVQFIMITVSKAMLVTINSLDVPLLSITPFCVR